MMHETNKWFHYFDIFSWENKLVFSKIAISIVFVLFIFNFPQTVFATIYQPGETLEPDCAPGAPNCGVVAFTATLGTNTPIGNSMLTIQATSTGSILATLRAITGQSANLLQVQDGNGVNLFTVNATGTGQFSNSLSVANGLTLVSLDGPLQANAGLVSATSSIGVLYGGTGLSSAPSFGNLLVGNSSGGYSLMATSSLGLSGGNSDSITEGTTNLFFTNNRFDARLTATTSLPGITTLSNLSLPATQLTNFGVPFYAFFSATTTSALAEGSNLYYTPGRVASVISGTTTDALAEGLTNLYFTNARASSNFATNLSATTTTALTEGTNLYYTPGRVASVISATTTDALREGLTNLYFTNSRASTNFASNLAATTTTALTEGTNLYFTGVRASSNFANNLAATTTSALAEGSNLYYTPGRVASVISGTTTDALAEGLTNLYFTNARVQSFLNASTTIAKTGSPNIFTATSTFNGGLVIDALNGPLQANNGVISATTSIGVLYGGTGTTNGSITGTGALTFRSANGGAGALTLDSGTTGLVNLGNGNNSKTINIGTGTAGNTVNIGTNDTNADNINIGSSQDALTITSTGLNVTPVGGLTGVQSIDTIAVAPSSILFATNGSIKSNTSSAITVDSGTTGNVNIGTGSNSKIINVGNTTGSTQLNLNAGSNGIFLTGAGAATAGNVSVCINSGTNQLFYGATDATCNPSSVRYKHDIADISLGLDAVNALRPVSYVYNSNNEPMLGFIAEEAATVDERLIARDKNGLIQAINPNAFTPILTRAIQQVSLLIGGISPKVNSDGSDNGLSAFVGNIQSESAHSPLDIITKKITDGEQFLTDFVAARVTSIRGYFDEVFAKKVHTEEICFNNPDGSDTCVNGEQLNSLLRHSNIPPSSNPVTSNNVTATPPVPESLPDTIVSGVDSTSTEATETPSETDGGATTTDAIGSTPSSIQSGTVIVP